MPFSSRVPSAPSFAQTTPLTPFVPYPPFLESLCMSIAGLQWCQLFCYGSVILIMSLICNCIWIYSSYVSHATCVCVQALEKVTPLPQKECKKIPHRPTLCMLPPIPCSPINLQALVTNPNKPSLTTSLG